MTSISSVTPQVLTASDATVTGTRRFTQAADDSATQPSGSQSQSDSQSGTATLVSNAGSSGGRITAPAGTGQAGKPAGAGSTDSSSSDDNESAIIKALKQQIDTLQKQLAVQMQQLQAAQNSNADEQTKAGIVATLQAGVTATSAALQQALAKLSEAITKAGGSSTGNYVNTTA